MTKRKLALSARFNQSLDEMEGSGRLTLLRATALEEALTEIQDNPMSNDGMLPDLKEPHWVKICFATGQVDTGLRVIFLLSEDGAIHLDNLILLATEQYKP